MPGWNVGMRTIPLSEAKDRLSDLVDEATATHEMVTITRHGRPAAVLMAAEDLESLEVTVYWLSQPGYRESHRQADEDERAGETLGSAAMRPQLQHPIR
jgi:antitoxin YefM